MGIRIKADEVLDVLTNAPSKSQVAIKMYAQEGAKKFENYAKTHRRWTDRTGRARASLTGWVETLTNVTRINISHGVDYGIWLELAHERKYAILQETVDNNAEEVLEGFKDLTKHLR